MGWKRWATARPAGSPGPLPQACTIIWGAEREFKQAIDLNPGYANAHHWFEMDPNFAQAHTCLAHSYEDKGMYKEAIEELQKAIALSKDNLAYVAYLGSAYARAGRRDEATKILNELMARSKREFVPAGLFCYIYAALGPTPGRLRVRPEGERKYGKAGSTENWPHPSSIKRVQVRVHG